ncbi:MAG: hypothetical protein QW567_02115 [Candidatus Hadarchaeales archaeon]
MKCRHGRLEFLGKEKGDGEANMYYICKECGSVLVFTKDKKAYSVVREQPCG